MTQVANSSKTSQPPTNKPKLSVQESLTKLANDPTYQALPKDKKLQVRSHIYDKFVEPYLRGKGVDTKNLKDTWVGNTVKQAPFGQSTTKENAIANVTQVAASFGKAGVRTERSLINITGSIYHFGLDKNHAAWFLNQYDRYATRRKGELDKAEDTMNTWLGADYNNNLKAKALRFPAQVTGTFTENLGYVAAGEGIGAIAGGILKGAPLTEGLQTTKLGKWAYSVLKGAAEGYVGAKLQGDSKAEAKSSAIGFGTFEGVVHAIPFLGRLVGIGGPKAVRQVIEAGANATTKELAEADTTKISTSLAKAGRATLDEVSQKLGYKDFEDARAKKQVYKVLNGVGELVRQADKEVGVHNPELVHLQAAEDLKELSNNPLGAKVLEIAKTNGADTIKDIVSDVIEATKATSGMDSVKVKINKQIAESIPKLVEGLGPGAASAKQKVVTNALANIIEANTKLQGRANQLTFAWANLDALPPEAKGPLAQEMKEIYGSKVKEWDAAARKLTNHIDDLVKTGHIAPLDMRGVFRTTKLQGEPTKWQRQLNAEVERVSKNLTEAEKDILRKMKASQSDIDIDERPDEMDEE